MRLSPEYRRLHKAEINRRLREDPQALISEEGERYFREIRNMAAYLDEAMPRRCLVLLAGPSAAGKTTTAGHLSRVLRENGRAAYTVSLDDFYRGAGKAPRLSDGSFDYETIEALNLPLLQSCMNELIVEGHTQLPRFDFLRHEPCDSRVELRTEENSVVIFEGIHALNPLLEEHLPVDNVFKLFINVMSPVYNGQNKCLARRDLRLIRRLLRDVRFRDSSFENTLDMWKQVVRGETLYLFPYVDTADAVFDTTHAYEPAMLGAELLPLLRQLPPDGRHAETVAHLTEALEGFEPLPLSYLPEDALLREFVG